MALSQAQIIQNVENKWLTLLTLACRDQFRKSHIPSHNETHHLRVWEHAKQIVKHIQTKEPFRESFLEQLIVAIFFHDQGMSTDSSEKHGALSRQLCEDFFESNKLVLLPKMDLVFQAIENHDNKDYKNASGSKKNPLLGILNIADDLDAFGVIGIYRYLEIYLMRIIPIHRIPETVIENLKNRYAHLTMAYTFDNHFNKIQKERFDGTVTFFNEMKEQVSQPGFNTDITDGPVGVARFINEYIVKQKRTLPEMFEIAKEQTGDSFFSGFFNELEKSF